MGIARIAFCRLESDIGAAAIPASDEKCRVSDNTAAARFEMTFVRPMTSANIETSGGSDKSAARFEREETVDDTVRANRRICSPDGARRTIAGAICDETFFQEFCCELYVESNGFAFELRGSVYADKGRGDR